MAATGVRDVSMHQERFLRHVVAHHRAGDHYPDPWMIGEEVRLTRAQTEAVLRDLRAIGWVAASPYYPERIRLTPRCWNALRRASASEPINVRNAA
jgi:hypothetical protein